GRAVSFARPRFHHTPRPYTTLFRSTTPVVHQQAPQTTETTQTTTSNPTNTREHAQVAHQQATRRPRRRPAGTPTTSNMLEHANVPHHRHQPRPAPRPTRRPAAPPTPLNTLVACTIDTCNGHKSSTSRQHTVHHTPSPETVAKHTPAKPDG